LQLFTLQCALFHMFLDEIESASVTQLSRRLKRGQGRWVFDRLVEKIIPYITQLHIALTK
jgi:hypothetical protein